MANLSVQNSTINFLMSIEGFRSKAYSDYKQWSIGYGSGTMLSGRPVRAGDVVTKAEALQMLVRDANKFAVSVNQYVRSAINQNQFDALVSFTYNLGPGELRDSTLLQVVNDNPSNYDAIAAQFRRWIYAGGVPNDGLKDRREKEIQLYQSGVVTSSVFFWLILIVALTLIIRKRRK